MGEEAVGGFMLFKKSFNKEHKQKFSKRQNLAQNHHMISTLLNPKIQKIDVSSQILIFWREPSKPVQNIKPVRNFFFTFTFRGFSTERARLGTLNQNFESLCV